MISSAIGRACGYCWSVLAKAAQRWFSSNLAVPASWFDKDDVESCISTPDGRYAVYGGLSLVAQRVIAITGMLIPVATARVATVVTSTAPTIRPCRPKAPRRDRALFATRTS